jgi:hypothetical protein
MICDWWMMKNYSIRLSTHIHSIDIKAEDEEDARAQAESWWYENVVPYVEVINK